jgi:hypothetical protein
VRNPSQNVLSRPIRKRKADERAARVVDSPGSDTNYPEVSLKIFVNEVVLEVIAARSAD